MLRGRTYQIAFAALAVLVVAVSCAAMLLDTGLDLPERYQQHEQARQLADLPTAEREAASSLSTDAATFASHLPVVSIDTGGQDIPGRRILGTSAAADGSTAEAAADGDDEPQGPVTVAPDGRSTIASSFSLFDSDEKANRLNDEPALSTQAELRIRGHSSRLFDKKSYLLHFTEQDRLTERDLDVLGMGADDEWALNGPFLDKTLVRNYLSLNMAGQIMPYVPDVRFCELFIDGQYQGVYVLMETVKHGDNRVAVRDSDPKSMATSFVVCRDWENADNPSNIYDLLDTMRVTRGAPLDVVYPSRTGITSDQFAWIEAELNAFEKALYSYDYDTSGFGYWTYVDVDSFVDYALINEFAGNIDAGSYSTYFYRDVRGKLCAGPVWDFNNAYDNYAEESFSDLGFFMPDKPLYFMLFKDEGFTDAFISRYRELRQTVLSEDALTSSVDQAIAYLGPAIERNESVWGYAYDPGAVDADNKLTPDERNPADYDEATRQLKSYLQTRGAWLDRNVENLKQYSHESVNKRYNH